jgi:adenylosuccinate lyase
MDSTQVFENPLVGRYCSPAMSRLWSPQRKFSTWRRLWLALAEAQAELGLLASDGHTPRINPEQLAALRNHLDDIDFAKASEYERRFRHDVMAHIHTLRDACPEAGDILHLGATSCYVTDNTDLILMREGLTLLRDQLVAVIDALATFALKWRDLPMLGFTHFQPAQLTTVGKRTCLWCQDFVLDLEEVEHRLATLRFRGVKGTTGTQASFLALFHGDSAKVRRLDEMVARKMGFEQVFPVTGQTYTRKLDSMILDTLSGIGQSAHKFGTDLRLLAHRRELDEPFEVDQIGSSAMPYKRNPMRAERMCGLARFVTTLPANTAATASTQWLERTLDDSVNRRLVLPQAFLATDAVLRLALNIARGMSPNPEVIRQQIDLVLPYMLTENLMMAAVEGGADRQVVHEVVRKHSLAVADALKRGAAVNDLLDRLRTEPVFQGISFENVQAESVVGRAPEQVNEFILEVVAPIRERYPETLGATAEVNV